jgi:hypothetical protein
MVKCIYLQILRTSVYLHIEVTQNRIRDDKNIETSDPRMLEQTVKERKAT